MVARTVRETVSPEEARDRHTTIGRFLSDRYSKRPDEAIDRIAEVHHADQLEVVPRSQRRVDAQ